LEIQERHDPVTVNRVKSHRPASRPRQADGGLVHPLLADGLQRPDRARDARGISRELQPPARPMCALAQNAPSWPDPSWPKTAHSGPDGRGECMPPLSFATTRGISKAPPPFREGTSSARLDAPLQWSVNAGTALFADGTERQDAGNPLSRARRRPTPRNLSAGQRFGRAAGPPRASAPPSRAPPPKRRSSSPRTVSTKRRPEQATRHPHPCGSRALR